MSASGIPFRGESRMLTDVVRKSLERVSNRFELVVFAFRRGLVECVRDE